MGVGPGGKRRRLLVPDMNPPDPVMAADRLRQPVQRIPGHAIHPLNARRDERFEKYPGHIICHDECLEMNGLGGRNSSRAKHSR